MPEVAEEMPVAAVLGEPRARLSRHPFRGGHAFMLGILNKYRDELGVQALPQELDEAVRETRAYLGTAAARVAIDGSRRSGSMVEFDVVVTSTTGHKLPTGYPSRRVWLHVRVVDAEGRALFESGAVRPDGSIAGNDNDDDPSRFETHYRVIDSADQVQIYESIMRAIDGSVTTGMLRATGYLKDNRLLPRGFDKTSAPREIAVLGAAWNDRDFTAERDRVRYTVTTAGRTGPFRVEIELRYQPISFRWVQNLRSYDAPETNRFVKWYDAMSRGSSEVLARATLSLP
jgi:hypothetical protein